MEVLGFNGRPTSPTLSPEEKTEAIKQYRSLPRDRQAVIQQLLKTPCAHCEQEFKVPNLGVSHGMCNRHYAAMRAENELPPAPANPKNKAVDLRNLSPEEIQLAVRLFALLRVKRNANRDAKEKAEADRKAAA